MDGPPRLWPSGGRDGHPDHTAPPACNPVDTWRILCGMRFLEASVAAATALSIAMLGLLLAAPLLAQPRSEATASVTAAPTPSAPAALPPIGLYLLRGPFSFGPCLALELTPESYPVAEDAEGIGTVLAWERGMTGCDSRSNEVQAIHASVTRILSEGADPGVVGHAVRFSLPLDGRASAVEIAILASQSTPTLLQALDTRPGSSGLVFDRVPSVDPVLDPLPSATPVPGTGVGPIGLYLLRGPFDSDGHCLAIELTRDAYPPDGAPGTTTILWWEHAGSDPDDPAVCLSRRGETDEVDGSVIHASGPGVPGGAPEFSYVVRFSVPASGGDVGDEVEIAILAGRSNEDQLQAVRVLPAGTERLVLDRVDELDPPLVTPSPSAGA